MMMTKSAHADVAGITIIMTMTMMTMSMNTSIITTIMMKKSAHADVADITTIITMPTRYLQAVATRRLNVSMTVR
jgi:hypothetical protein